MTKNLTLAMLGILTACALYATANAQVSIGYVPVAAPAQDGGYAANARPFSVASAYDGPPPAATPARAFVAPSVTAPVIETNYRPMAGAPTPAVNYVTQPIVQTASYQPATGSYYRSLVNTSAPVSYVQPVRAGYPTSYVPPTTGVPTTTNYAQPIGTVQPISSVQQVQALQPIAGSAGLATNPCCCPTTNFNPAAGAFVAPTIGQPVPARSDYAWSPVIALRAPPSDFTVGQGLLGQPKVYVEGEPVRNFFRYILP